MRATFVINIFVCLFVFKLLKVMELEFRFACKEIELFDGCLNLIIFHVFGTNFVFSSSLFFMQLIYFYQISFVGMRFERFSD